jgi:hypothetical protein
LLTSGVLRYLWVADGAVSFGLVVGESPAVVAAGVW